MIYVLEMHAGLGGYSRIIKVVKVANAKDARKIASKIDGMVRPRDWNIIARVKRLNS